MSSDKKKTKKKGSPKNQRIKGSSKNETTGKKKQVSKSRHGSSRKRSSRKVLPGYQFLRRFRVIFLLFIIFSCLCISLLDVSEATSGAMMPAIHKGDIVLSWSPKFSAADYPSGSIALIRNEDNENAPNFLRIIGTAGNDVSFDGDKLQVNGEDLARISLTNEAIARPPEEPVILRETLPNGTQYRIMLPRQVIAGPVSGKSHIHDNEFFAVGDNRMASYDSRLVGNYPADRMKGRVLFVLKSSENDGILGHWFKWVK